MMRCRTTFSRGFTLVELLVATGIFSVLVGALYTLLHGSLKLRETAYNAVEAGIPRAQIAQIIRRDLEGAVMPTGLIANLFYGEQTPQGNSRQDTIEFYSTTGVVTDTSPWADVQKIRYSLEAAENGDAQSGMNLLRNATRNLIAEVVEEGITTDNIEESTLLSGMESFTVTYWDADALVWVDEWDSSAMENANPAAVSVRIDFPSKKNSSGAEYREPPIEIVCEIAPQPRPAPTVETAGGGGA